MPLPLITAYNLEKRFKHTLAVDRIRFEIMAGECFGFLGPNGAGKTSTMKMIYCFSPVSSGELRVMGHNVMEAPSLIKREMGVVPQEDNLDPDLKVLENLLIYARYFDIPKKEALARSKELVEFFQLEEKSNEPIGNLSGGMKRRLVIARGLINRPKVLILDEPTTGLDPQARHVIWNKLRSLKKGGVTLVLTTHYMEEASQLCDRLVIMDKGKILAEGVPSELIKKYVGKEVYEIRGPKKVLKELLERLRNHKFETDIFHETLYLFVKDSIPISEELLQLVKSLDFHHRMATLEDVFLKIAGRELKD